MQVSETSVEGLKRELKVVIEASELNSRLDNELEEIKGTAQIKGFRKGKVPVNHLKKLYGKSIMADVVQKLVEESTEKTLEERNEKPAFRPEIKMTEDEKEIEKILNGEADLAYSVKFEILPPIELADISDVEIEKPVIEPDEKEIEEQISEIAKNAAGWEEKEGPAEDGDRVKVDFIGLIDGEEFEGGSAEDADVVIGAKQFIPGFEEQLVGVKAGDDTEIKVTFPDDYPASHLAGKDAVFKTKVKLVEKALTPAIDDEMAKTIGFESLDKLREMIRDNRRSEMGKAVRATMKRAVLDALDEKHQFDLPPTLVDSEVKGITEQVKQREEMEKSDTKWGSEDAEGQADSEDGKSAAKSEEDYRKIAERRVKLGLVISEFGKRNNIEVDDQEVNNSLMRVMQQFPGQEQQIVEYYKNTPGAIAELRAPIFEDKVIDFLLELVKTKEKSYTKEEFEKVLEEQMKDDDEF